MVETVIGKVFEGTPFGIEVEPVKNDNSWGSVKVSIFRDKGLIGEYVRNYDSFGPNTFYPFEIDDQWYALYSASYTSTRVMKLNESSIEDWCGEDPEADGFCPVEYYVPRYFHYEKEIRVDCCFPDLNDGKCPPLIKTSYPRFAFLSGCYWGDDTSWKLRFVDLSKVPEKILEITDKFGYWELPGLPLKECITIKVYEKFGTEISIIKEESFRID